MPDDALLIRAAHDRLQSITFRAQFRAALLWPQPPDSHESALIQQKPLWRYSTALSPHLYARQEAVLHPARRPPHSLAVVPAASLHSHRRLGSLQCYSDDTAMVAFDIGDTPHKKPGLLHPQCD